MHRAYRITIYSLLLLSPLKIFATGDSLLTKAADSLGRTKLRDSLSLLQEKRKSLCVHPSGNYDAFSVSTARLFSEDATSPSEMLATSPFSVPVRFGLSSQLNRFLPFGFVVPVSTIYRESPLIPTPAGGMLNGADDISIGEISSIGLGPNNTYRYSLYPVDVAVPEGSFLWENGVFNENLLNVRFLRPLSEQLSINVFSSYRYFTGKHYSHTGNNVASFYQALYPDTNFVSNGGYNPLTNDFSAGTRLNWTGARGNKLVLGMTYDDWSDEMALNRPPQSQNSDNPFYLLDQFKSTIDFGAINNRCAGAIIDVNGRFENATIVKHTPDSIDNTITLRSDGADQIASFAARAAYPLRETDTLALRYRAAHDTRDPFDMPESRSLDQSPAISLTAPYHAGPLLGACSADAGYFFGKLGNTSGYAPVWSVSADNDCKGQRLRVYASQSVLPYSAPFDSTFFLSSTLLDICRTGGADITLSAKNAGCILGCQSIEGVSDVTVSHEWPGGVAPYEQPRLVFLAAPYFGPWRGLTITSRGLFADRKPLVKAQVSATYSAHPRNTGEYIDLRLCLDYWGERDPIVFAGETDWNREIYDLNLELAVHVKTFRFFSRLSNLLDRKISYVPGYTLPGLTFRWGITWYLQR